MVDITATSSRKQHSLEMLWLVTFPMGDVQARQKRLIDVFFLNKSKISFRAQSNHSKNHMMVFGQTGFQSVSSPFSARLHSSSAKSLRALITIPPATQVKGWGNSNFCKIEDLKLLCFMLSQVLKLLILKYYFHTKEKKCPTATLSGQDEANLAF